MSAIAIDYAPMADSIIYGTAMDSGADLLTCDMHSLQLPRVRYLPKVVR